jgi:hypothetical protein
MHAALFLGLIFISAMPSDDAITAAKSKVEDLYGDELAAAKKPKEKIALAAELLKTANSMGNSESDEAARYVLAKTARKLAVEAGDKKTAFDAVTMLVERFADAKDIDPSAELKNGDYVWKQAQHATAGVKLDFQIQAAECYLKVKKAGTGLDKRLAEKRLGEVMAGQGTGKPSDLKYIIGEWEITSTFGGEPQHWTFYKDGTVKSPKGQPVGAWTAEPDRILIKWPDKRWNAWHSFARPLSLHVTGSSNDGDDVVRATKIR